MYRVVVTARAKRDLKKIPRIYKKAIAETIEELAMHPREGKQLKRDLTGRFSYRISVYRIVYTINEKDKIVRIITAGHRATIYQ